MAFFDKLNKTVFEAGQKTIDKTKEIADTSKLNSMISEEEKKINNLYYHIGKLYVSLHSFNCEAEFEEMVNTVVDAQNKIEDYKKQIQDIKGIQRCEKCGAEIPKEAIFCSACGALVKISAPENPNYIACSNCGEQIQKDAIFCTRCGAKVILPVKEELIDTELQEKESVQSEGTEGQMKLCRVCGSKMPEELIFCTECGTKFETECKVEAIKKCPKCGEELVEEAIFCTECGHKL